jgi:protein-tyrosine phosphatase
MTIIDDLAERLVPLEGGVNFRDLGGYATTNGATVRKGQLFRSGTMGRLTANDRETLARIGIRTVVDFRSLREQDAEPNLWASEPGGPEYWARPHTEVFGHLHDMIDRGIESTDHARQIMANGFRLLPEQQAPAYAELFRRLADGKLPLVFNCTAGKDRTGGAAALVLASLGVPRATIVADFHLTDRAVDLRATFAARPHERTDRYAGLDRSVMAPLGEAHPSYAEAFLDGIDERWGSVDGYLAEQGVTAAMLDDVRAHLLDG